MDSQFNWLPYVMQESKTTRIKDEPTDPNTTILSTSPSSNPLSVTRSSSTSRRGSTPSSTGPKRQRPYPSLTSDLSTRRPKSGTMSSHTYGTWSGLRGGSGRSHHPERRSSDEEDQSAYGSLNPYMNEPQYLANVTEAEFRPPSSNSSLTSSLTGAMGETSLSQSRSSRSPPSNVYSGPMPSQELGWSSSQMNMAMSNTTYSGHSNLAFTNMASSSVNPMSFNEYTGTRNPSPTESIAPPSPPYPQAFADQYNRGQMGMHSSRSAVGYGGSGIPAPFPADVSMPLDASANEHEVRQLRRKVRELQMELHRSRTALETLRHSVPNSSALPTPPHSSTFQAGWKARTEARKKLFCSLNRAGNALCAWHDSRRERRAYPPRNAPPGYLNCGCTYDEALFEESLSRHGVGSYHPGETVRMDPALRNPLLKLLEKRYGYKDGDFEHDPITEEWSDGESPSVWEQKAHSGQIVRRRPDPNANSHDRA